MKLVPLFHSLSSFSNIVVVRSPGVHACVCVCVCVHTHTYVTLIAAALVGFGRDETRCSICHHLSQVVWFQQYEQSLEASGHGVHAANHTGVFPPQRQWDPFEVREAV